MAALRWILAFSMAGLLCGQARGEGKKGTEVQLPRPRPQIEAAVLEERPLSRTWWPYWIGTAAGLALGAGTYTYILMNPPSSASTDLEGDLFGACLITGSIGWAASGILAVTGVVSHITWSPEDPQHPLNLAEVDRPLARTWWPYLAGSAAAAAVGFGSLYAFERYEDHDVVKASFCSFISGFAVSGILAVTGLSLHITWGPAEEEPAGPALVFVGPTAMPGGAGLSLGIGL